MFIIFAVVSIGNVDKNDDGWMRNSPEMMIKQMINDDNNDDKR
jgi:hypothetical protein